MAKTTWDVWVVLANDPSQTIAYVPRWKSIQLSDQISDVGSATIEHDFSDPFFAAFQLERADSLLDGPYALQIRRNGTAVFTFFIEDVQVDRAGVSQPLTIGGRGIASSLEWAIVLPEDFSNQARATAGTTQRPKFFDRLFPGYSYSVRVATTANLAATYTSGPQADVPGSGARLTATSNGNINNSGIDGVTDLVVGDTVLVKNQTTAFQNGIYWIVTVGDASNPFIIQRTAKADGSPISDLAVDNTAFVSEGTTNGYTSFKISANGSLSNSNQVGTNSITWSAVTLGSFTGVSAFYILFEEADTGYEYSTKRDDFGTVKTLNGRGGTGYAVDWPLSLDSTLDTSLGKTDSKGRVVQDGGNFNIAVGRTLMDVLNEVASNTNVDWHVSPLGVISIAVRPFVTSTVTFAGQFGDDLTTGADALLFSLPMLESVETRTSVVDLRTVVYGSDGFNLDRQISDRTGTYGFRELFIENSSDTAPAVANITAAAVRTVRDGKLQITATFAEREGMTAWTDFDIGDKVLVEIDTGTYSERIISAIGASVDEDGNETVEVTFGDVFEDIASNLKYAANYGRLGAAEIPTFTLRGTSSKPSAPTGTSVGAEVTGLSNRVVVNFEVPDNTSATQFEAVVYREEQNSVGTAIIYPITNIFRNGNIARGTTSSAHGYGVGDLINIYDTTNNFFDRTNVFLTSASGSSFTFDDVGPDIATGTYTSGDIARVVERHSTMVGRDKVSAQFENLAAPGREYNFTIIPYTVNGQSGLPSPPFAFTASSDPQVVFNGAIRSNNYVANTSGWTIEASGNAELNQVTIRNGAWVQGTLTAPTLQTATSNPRIVVTSSGLIATNSGGTTVTSIDATTGAFTSTSATISGNITANSLSANATITSPVITGGTIDIGGADTSSFHVDVDGNIWLGAATYAAAPFKVSNAGALVATSATISGVVVTGGAAADINNNGTTISGGKITADSITATQIAADSIGASEIIAGSITATEISSSYVYAGTISANQINAGSVSADRISGGTITGVTFNASVGNIGGFTLSSGSLVGASASTIINPNGNINMAGALNASGQVNSGGDMNATGSIEAGTFFTTSGYINAGTIITAGSYIESSTTIQAGTQFIGIGAATVSAGSSTNLRRRDSDGQFRIEASKRELKKDITDIQNSVDLIQGLNPVSFRFKDESDYDLYSNEIKQNYLLRKEYGFIAEDVAQAVPDLGIYTPDKNSGELVPHMWQQNGVIALCVGAIKDLVAQIETLEARIATLESKS